MPFSFRIVLPLTLLALFCFGAKWAEYAQNTDESFTSLPSGGATDSMDTEARRSAELEEQYQQFWIRWRKKRQIILELADRKISLLSAAQQFRQIARKSGGLDKAFWHGVRLFMSGSTDQERLCRHVILYAGATLSDNPARAEAVTSRLENELAIYLSLGLVAQ